MHALDRILVTGAAGFVGSSFVAELLEATDALVVGLDSFNSQRKPWRLDENLAAPRHHFVVGDIADATLIDSLLRDYEITAVVNCASESSVDRSIGDPLRFVENNILGTARLLDKVAEYWDALSSRAREMFRFVQSSTIEVYGSTAGGGSFTEETVCAPNSPYAASKAASDNVACSYFRTYGVPTLIARASTNYGPSQAIERLIPRTTCNALKLHPLLVYGDGLNERDWIHVADQCRGIRRILEQGQPGRIYNLGSGSVRSNLDVVQMICRIIDEHSPGPMLRESMITFVDDRPGHDRSHAMDCGRARRELGWCAETPFEKGLHDTVRWYIERAESGSLEVDCRPLETAYQFEGFAGTLSTP